jgi:hypothetical protein
MCTYAIHVIHMFFERHIDFNSHAFRCSYFEQVQHINWACVSHLFQLQNRGYRIDSGKKIKG